MRKFAFLTLGFCGLLLGTPSCGKDEATGDDLVGLCGVCDATNDCESALVCKSVTGGNARCANRLASECCSGDTCYPLGPELGSGGSGGGILGGGGGGGKSGAAGKGGTGGSGTFVPNTSSLGAVCNDDDDCADSRLTCLKSDDLEDGSGPPNGLCTLTCETDGACLEFTDDAYCVDLGDGSYCIEGCTTGGSFEPKCQQRADFSCSLLGLVTGTEECESSTECGPNQLCGDTGLCGDIVTACLPTCGGDFDCDAGQFCDFASGFCVAEKPTGLSIGSPCNPQATTDPCDGFCVPTPAGGTQGKCEAFCSLSESLIGCGWDGSGRAEAACLFGTILSPPGDYGTGDLGICGQLCDCNEDCRIRDEYCIDDFDGAVAGIWGRNGYCRPLQTGENVADTFDECPDGSSGGAGGQSGGGAGGNAGDGSGEPPPAGAGGEAGAGQGGQGGA
jgi:hypothetical protein